MNLVSGCQILITRVLLIMRLCGVVGCAGPLARHWDVTTTQGTVRGYYKPNPSYFAFLGVPYARPPTGYDRFKAPKPPANWDGIYEATYKVKCPQRDIIGNQNCLVVNIFTPALNQNNMSVVIHFHDGHFQKGWGFYNPAPHLIRNGIIIITFNFRISSLGFLCLRTAKIPGNAGLKDQVAALYWIQRNIEKFKGNPRDVTVYGTGSGAVSIEILLFSTTSEGLFQKAILESGSILSPSSISYDPINTAFGAARELGYKGSTIKTLEEFFIDISSQKLVNTTTICLPCIEKNSLLSLLHNDPLKLLKSFKFLQIPMMILYSDSIEIEMISNDERFTDIPEDFGQLLPNNLDIDQKVRQKVAKLTKAFYFGNFATPEDITQNYIDYVNDIFMEYPLVKLAAHYSHRNAYSVFLMKFRYKMRNDKTSSYRSNYGKVFQYIFSDKSSDTPDHIADILRSIWSNFIKLGDPTPITTALVADIWIPLQNTIIIDEKVNFQKINYLHFGHNLQNKEISTQQFTFWEQIYNKFYKYHSTY